METANAIQIRALENNTKLYLSLSKSLFLKNNIGNIIKYWNITPIPLPKSASLAYSSIKKYASYFVPEK